MASLFIARRAFLIFFSLVISNTGQAFLCSEVYQKESKTSSEVHWLDSAKMEVEYFSIDGTLVTNALKYPVATIMKNLGAHEGHMQNKRILSVGEGIGLLLPHPPPHHKQIRKS